METLCNEDTCAVLEGKEALASSGFRSVSPVYRNGMWKLAKQEVCYIWNISPLYQPGSHWNEGPSYKPISSLSIPTFYTCIYKLNSKNETNISVYFERVCQLRKQILELFSNTSIWQLWKRKIADSGVELLGHILRNRKYNGGTGFTLWHSSYNATITYVFVATIWSVNLGMQPDRACQNLQTWLLISTN